MEIPIALFELFIVSYEAPLFYRGVYAIHRRLRKLYVLSTMTMTMLILLMLILLMKPWCSWS